MKKLGIIIVITLIVCGCTGKINENNMIYKSYIEELKEYNGRTTSKDIVSVDIELERNTSDEITYRVTIDEALVKMKKIEAIVYHDKKTSDIFPSIGVFDQKLNLVPGLKKNNDDDVKGLILVGYIKTKQDLTKFKSNIKVMILYNDKNNERQKIYYTKSV